MRVSILVGRDGSADCFIYDDKHKTPLVVSGNLVEVIKYLKAGQGSVETRGRWKRVSVPIVDAEVELKTPFFDFSGQLSEIDAEGGVIKIRGIPALVVSDDGIEVAEEYEEYKARLGELASALYEAALDIALDRQDEDEIRRELCEKLNLLERCDELWAKARPLLSEAIKESEAELREYIEDELDKMIDLAVRAAMWLAATDDWLAAESEMDDIRRIIEDASYAFENELWKRVRRIAKELHNVLKR